MVLRYLKGLVKWISTSLILVFGSEDEVDVKSDTERKIFNIFKWHFFKMHQLWYYDYEPKLNHVIVIHEYKRQYQRK